VSAAEDAAPVSAAEAKALFRSLAPTAALVLAVSGGPDSTALLFLAARWRRILRKGPKLYAVTINHGLRPESANEANAVARLSRRLGVPHRILRWEGRKPKTGLQQAARQARYRLLTRCAATMKAGHILTAHTLDDQAETVLIRMTRGSGLSGLCGMRHAAPVPASEHAGIMLVRPLLDIPKARLVATLRRAKIEFADDPSNVDPRFTRARLRQAMPMLAREGLDARRLALLARRLQRAEAALEIAVDAACAALSRTPWRERAAMLFDADQFARLPADVGLRLLGRAIAHCGDGGAIRLGRLEALHEALMSAHAGRFIQRGRWRRSLAGALVTLSRGKLMIERAPARTARRNTLTTGKIRRTRRLQTAIGW
jgi:tRNA(Ile)-lysidine synthase